MTDNAIVSEADARPNGVPGQCFYCKQTVGSHHRADCVVPSKFVRIKAVIEMEIKRPASFSVDEIEFGLNEGSWCADNILVELDEFLQRMREQGRCLCEFAHFEVVDSADMGKEGESQ